LIENLYLIRCNGYFKIGIANDLQTRLEGRQTGNPYPLVVDACFGFPNAAVVEKALHQSFAGVRKIGECFASGEDDIQRFITICRLLSGVEMPFGSELVNIADIESAEEAQEVVLDTPRVWDFASLFADGWSLLTTDSRKRYWCWRKRKNGEDKVIYGGVVHKLPYPIDVLRQKFGASDEA
jgi:hypothetical protein